ncbi:MAG: EamA family transporter [Clostridia bacterium]|nr:EamA family transporter [Clostridia bacterium]
MLGYLLIAVFTLLNLTESVLVRNYAKKHGSGGMLMNAIVALFATLFFVITDTDGFYAPIEMIPIAVLNAFLFGAGFYTSFLAYRCGPYGLTRLISNFSLLFSIFYGIFFLNEQPGITTYIGIVMIFAAMVLINYKKKGEDEKGVSLKWFICVTISLVANGFIAILTRMQQIRFNDTCSKEFQIISIGGSFLLLAVIGLILDRDKLARFLKHGVLYGIGAGIANGAKNFLTLVIYMLLPLSVVSPMKTGLGMLATFALALFVYKEKYSKKQIVGVILGVAAVLLLAF